MKIEKVVVGVDFSRAALETAKWVAHHVAPDAELVLVHVLEERPPAFFPDTFPPPAAPTGAEIEAAELGLRDLAKAVSAAGVRTKILVGRAHDVLREVASEVGADLIAVGPHGNRQHESRLLGTTADRLLRTAHTPVLIGARQPAARPVRVVAGVDESAITPSVLAWTRMLATRFEARVTVLHAMSNQQYSHELSMAAATAASEAEAAAEVAADMRRETERWLHETALSGFDTAGVDAMVTHGSAAECILDAARREHAALIVLGRREAVNGFPALLGRTLRHVLHDAPCPVLVVPPPHDEIEDEPE